MSKIIGVTVGTPLSVGKIEEKLKPVKKEYVDSTFATKETAAGLESRIKIHDKRITNIEKGFVPEAFETDSSVAYVKDVPADACPFAAVNTLGGMTRKCTQLIPYPYYEGMSATVSGITFVVNDSGGININGTATDVVNFVLVKDNASFLPPNANISLSLKNGTDSVYLVTGGAGSALPLSYSNNYSAIAPSDGVLGYCLIQILAGAVVSNLTVYPMINKGSTALPPEPYFEGLRSAPTTEVESVGVNLFNADSSNNENGKRVGVFDGTVYAADGYGTSGYIEILPSTLYKLYGVTKEGFKSYFAFYDSNKQYIIGTEWAMGFAKTTPVNCRYIRFDYPLDEIGAVMFTEGDTEFTYRPYAYNTLPIPEAVQALDCYGDGVNESVYNYIDYEKKQFVKRVGSVDLGTRMWTKESLANNRFRFTSYVLDIKSSANAVTKANALCAVADTITNANSYNGSEYGFAVSHSDSTICLGGAEYDGMTAEQFTAAMSGVMLYYELAAPEVTDISDILPADNYIGVEGGGTLTFKNQFEFDVPSEVTYQIKEATV